MIHGEADDSIIAKGTQLKKTCNAKRVKTEAGIIIICIDLTLSIYLYNSTFTFLFPLILQGRLPLCIKVSDRVNIKMQSAVKSVLMS